MKAAIFLLVVLLIAAVLPGQHQDAFAVRTTVASGTIEGNYNTKTGLQEYFGIPFAAPPVGDLRWRAPQPVASWSGVKETKAFGPRPIQKFIFSDMRFRSSGVSEDCLYLNVWTPARKDTKNLPVLLYYYGGGNTAGAADEYRYDGAALAQKGIVVVTANYRLNAFGFLAHPELSAETEYGGSGNYGHMDQAAALRWVHDNIAAFGGNPDRITIAGESAGSMAVNAQMASPLARDLIAGAVGQSGAYLSPTMAPVSMAEAEATGRAFVKAAGCTSIAELRRAPTQDIYEAFFEGPGFNLSETIDGYFLTEPILDTYRSGKQSRAPLLVGWTSTEVAWLPSPASAAAYVEKVRKLYPEEAATALSHYPATNPAWSNTQLESDRWLVYPTWKWAELHAATTEQPVYRYRFDKIRPPLVGQDRDTEPLGAGHASDIEYFLGNIPLADEYAWREPDRTTSATMVAYLANFIKTGDPNGADLPRWQPTSSDATHPPVMLLDVKSQQINADDARFRFHDRLHYPEKR